MKLVIISGKGGTGKTTIASSFAYLANPDMIKVDCDVDASNLHLMFEGEDYEINNFSGAKVAGINTETCINCGKCIENCRFGAINFMDGKTTIDSLKCEGCGVCKLVCEEKAVDLEYEVTGQTYLTQTVKGIISRAELIPGAEGSGKLVTHVRSNAERIGLKNKSDYIIDGSPGIGCAVMASITGCDYCVVVTEPSQTGYEDFIRIYELIKYFKIEASIIINKFDINHKLTKQIEMFCNEEEMQVIGKVPFDDGVGFSINEGKPVVSYKSSIAGQSIIKIWDGIKSRKGE